MRSGKGSFKDTQASSKIRPAWPRHEPTQMSTRLLRRPVTKQFDFSRRGISAPSERDGRWVVIDIGDTGVMLSDKS